MTLNILLITVLMVGFVLRYRRSRHPKAEAVMQKICSIPLSPIGFYWAAHCEVAGVKALVSRTGYTGEDGFEAYFPAANALKVWDAIFAAGKEFDIAILCGWR